MDCVNLTYKISDKTILNNINLSFSESGIHLIIGPNGAGKSTLLSLLAKQKKATSGKILIDTDEKPTSKRNEKTDLSNLNETQFYKRVVFSGNYDTPFHEVTVKQFLLLNRYLKTGVLEFDENVEKLVDFFELKPFLYRYINSLSSGERQRIVLASLFLLEREYIIMDEPFSALDISARYEMSEKITQYITPNQKIIVVSHSFELINYSKSTTAIKNGSLFFSGGKISESQFYELFDIKQGFSKNFFL